MARSARNKPEGVIQDENDGTESLKDVASYYETNKKRINTIALAIVVLVGGYFGYKYLVQAPNAEKAATAISYPQQLFMADSTNLALNGDGQHMGFLSIIRKYKGTDAANLSHYYAGVCFLKEGDFEQAIKYLKDFDGKGTTLAYTAWGVLGDAYMETGNIAKGIEYYTKASSKSGDDVLAPIYLYRLGVAYEMNQQADKAKAAYERVRDEYPQSQAAQNIAKDLARLGVVAAQ